MSVGPALPPGKNTRGNPAVPSSGTTQKTNRQNMNNTPNTEQNSSTSPSNEWRELLQTPEVMSSSGSPSSRDINQSRYYEEFASSSIPISSSSSSSSSSSRSSSSSHPSHDDVTTAYSNFIQGAYIAPKLDFTVNIRATCNGGPKGTARTFSNIRIESITPDPCEKVQIGLDNQINKVAILTDKVKVSAYGPPVYDPDTETTAQKILVSWEGKIWEHDHKNNPFPYDPNGRDIQNNSMQANNGERWAIISCGK